MEPPQLSKESIQEQNIWIETGRLGYAFDDRRSDDPYEWSNRLTTRILLLFYYSFLFPISLFNKQGILIFAGGTLLAIFMFWKADRPRQKRNALLFKTEAGRQFLETKAAYLSLHNKEFNKEITSEQYAELRKPLIKTLNSLWLEAHYQADLVLNLEPIRESLSEKVQEKQEYLTAISEAKGEVALVQHGSIPH